MGQKFPRMCGRDFCNGGPCGRLTYFCAKCLGAPRRRDGERSPQNLREGAFTGWPKNHGEKKQLVGGFRTLAKNCWWTNLVAMIYFFCGQYGVCWIPVFKHTLLKNTCFFEFVEEDVRVGGSLIPILLDFLIPSVGRRSQSWREDVQIVCWVFHMSTLIRLRLTKVKKKLWCKTDEQQSDARGLLMAVTAREQNFMQQWILIQICKV